MENRKIVLFCFVLFRFEAVLSVISSLADVDDDRRDIVLERFKAVLIVINFLADVDDDHRDIVFKWFEAV